MSEPYIGEIKPFAFGYAPKGWAVCNGQILQINTNQALFAILGTRYGGDGITTFALPNLQGRTPIGFSPSQGIPLAQAGGEENHTLTINEMPAHTHQVFANAELGTLTAAQNNTWAATPAGRNAFASTPQAIMSPQAIGVTGGSQPHNNMQPYTVISFCIALVGIFPTQN